MHTHRKSEAGFTLVEMIVVSMLLLVAMLGLLAVFDASARINKSETDVADAQGAVRYAMYQITRVVRMAGSGGLPVTQAVLNHSDSSLPGITPAVSYDNVAVVVVTDTLGNAWNVRLGTDVIEIRGVILSPLLGFDPSTGCTSSQPCTGSTTLNVRPITGDDILGQHVNNDNAQRPQFAAIDTYTAAVDGTHPMFVMVVDGDSDMHSSCADATPGGTSRYPQPVYNVGLISDVTKLATLNTFQTVDFGNALAQKFNGEMPSLGGAPATPIANTRRAGILDDIIFFVTTDPNLDPQGLHPILMQGIRRGDAYEVSRLAEDVEDMQVAYGVDTNGDNAITRTCPGAPPDDQDANYSTTNNCDEWVPNGSGETTPYTDVDFQAENPFNPIHSALSRHCPRLHGVMVSILAKSKDPDPTYKAPSAKGYKLMNSTALPVQGNYRRRVQTLKINLRNYSFQG